MDYNQKNRWSDTEIQLIRDVFKDKEFVYAVRDVLMGFTEKFNHAVTTNTMAVLAKELLSAYSPDVPLRMQQDTCYLSLGHISGFNAEQGVLRIKAFDLSKDYLERRFRVLVGIEDTGDSLVDFREKTKATDDTDRFVRMLAYLQIGEYIDSSLARLVSIAETKEENKAEIQARMAADSAK